MLAHADHIEVIDENLKHKYARMPRPVLKAPGLSFRAKCIYCLLLDYAREKDSCFPGQEQMAQDLDTSVDTIQRGIQELKDYGLITWKRQGFNKPNVYSILRLSDCPKLRIVSTPKQDTAKVRHESPEKCGIASPQNCGSNESKSKENQERNEDSSKNTSKGRDEVSAVPPVQQTTKAAYSHSLQTTRKREEKPLPCIGKPLTQEEIDSKKKQGMNISGLTPLSHIIPAEHWQELEAKNRQTTIKKKTHFNSCTKNAPMMIDATLEQFTSMLGDEPENTAININRASKLYRKTGIAEETFREKLYEAFDQARRYPTEAIKKKRRDGRPNRMPVFFSILEERVAAR